MKIDKVGLLSIPYDENSSFSKGPANAPGEIKEALFTGSLNKGTENDELLVWDENIELLGEIKVSSPDSFVSEIESWVKVYTDSGYGLVTLGGDHSISYPIIKGLANTYSNLNIIHIDAHTDLYDEFKGNRHSNACPFARIMESDLVSSLHQYGIRTLNAHQRQQIARFGVHSNEMKDWPSPLPVLDGPVYLSIDMDGIDPAFAPGVSHREPGGLTTREVINIIHQIDAPVIGVDIVEYNPDFDVDKLTATLAAKLVKEAAGKILQSV